MSFFVYSLLLPDPTKTMSGDDDDYDFKRELIEQIEKQTDELKANIDKTFDKVTSELVEVKFKFLRELDINKRELINEIDETTSQQSAQTAAARLVLHKQDFKNQIDKSVRSCTDFIDNQIQIDMFSIGKLKYQNFEFSLKKKLKNMNYTN